MSMATLDDIIAANRAGQTIALPSICSAHRDVLRAVMLLPEGKNMPLLIEATSNQVNQFGGYTGMKPDEFVTYVMDIARETGFDRDRIILGGDHLGPQVWKSEPSDSAMRKAEQMMIAYVKAGFTKIHLDCSEICADDETNLTDVLVAQRAAQLADICETHAPEPHKLSYIIGTEVPVPGGARANHHGILPTTPDAALATINAHLKAFSSQAQEKIVGLVVQPGVEFSSMAIDHLPQNDVTNLKTALADYPKLTFEAHSTDYQQYDAYPRLAQFGFAIHKVGPALTFAYRQAIYALDMVYAALTDQTPSLKDVLEDEMLAAPQYWQNHYTGSAEEVKLQRHYSYSDRIRYYWLRPAVKRSVDALMKNLSARALPEPLLSQFFSPSVLARSHDLPEQLDQADRIILAAIQDMLAPYYFAPQENALRESRAGS